MNTLEAIAKLCNISPSYIMGWNENEPAAPSALPPIMEYYNQLNDEGKAEATKRVEELTCLPKYTENIEKTESSHWNYGKNVG